jgi:TusA-related sulfurtransferase/uncharacterized protein (DUF2249 family)
MKINQNTKISKLINENPDVIDAIVSINKHFEKLRNPVLRKILASRVTIADAAKIGGTTIQTFYEKLSPLGFYCEGNDDVGSDNKISIPDFYKELTRKNTQVLDVRNDIAAGKDPFNKIMDELAQMPETNVLDLINSFEPIPLINLLEKKGYISYVIHKDTSLIHTYIKYTNTKNNNSSSESALSMASSEEMETIIKSYREKIINIDVRDLEMPLPMVTILGELETMLPNTLLYVLHNKVPVHLFPELHSRGYLYKVKKINEEKVLILIYK